MTVEVRLYVPWIVQYNATKFKEFSIVASFTEQPHDKYTSRTYYDDRGAACQKSFEPIALRFSHRLTSVDVRLYGKSIGSHRVGSHRSMPISHNTFRMSGMEEGFEWSCPDKPACTYFSQLHISICHSRTKYRPQTERPTLMVKPIQRTNLPFRPSNPLLKRLNEWLNEDEINEACRVMGHRDEGPDTFNGVLSALQHVKKGVLSKEGRDMGQVDDMLGETIYQYFDVSQVMMAEEDGRLGAMGYDGKWDHSRDQKRGLKTVQSMFPCGPIRESGRRRAFVLGLDYDGPSYNAKHDRWVTPITPEDRGYSKASELEKAAGEKILVGARSDAMRWSDFLKKTAGFNDEDIMLLTDDQQSMKRNGRINKEGMIRGLKWLRDGAKSGDVLFFSFSGHGGVFSDGKSNNNHTTEDCASWSYIAPLDTSTPSTRLRQKEIFDILLDPEMGGIPEGVKLILILDCCHSGAGLGLPYHLQDAHMNRAGQWKDRQFACYPVSDVIMFAGCTMEGQSQDLNIRSGSRVTTGGLLSMAFITTLTRNPHHSWESMLRQIRKVALSKGVKQVPQLFASQKFNISRKVDFTGDILPNSNMVEGVNDAAAMMEHDFTKSCFFELPREINRENRRPQMPTRRQAPVAKRHDSVKGAGLCNLTAESHRSPINTPDLSRTKFGGYQPQIPARLVNNGAPSPAYQESVQNPYYNLPPQAPHDFIEHDTYRKPTSRGVHKESILERMANKALDKVSEGLDRLVEEQLLNRR